jgi:hypothetical protein
MLLSLKGKEEYLMALCKWEENDWDDLIDAINYKKCILMLGPETAFENSNGFRKLYSVLLAEQLAEKIEPEIKEKIDQKNLAEVSNYFLSPNKKGRSRNNLISRVKNFYLKDDRLTTSFHQDLAALPFYLTLTTSPDILFLNALRERKKSPNIGYFNFNKGKSEVNYLEGTEDQPLIFYLFGSLQDPESLVITENELLDFLISILTPKGLPNDLVSELQDPEKSFLFLGFGFKNWYLRILLRVLNVKIAKNNCSFAIEDFTPFNKKSLESTALFYSEGYCKVHFFEKSLEDFAKELRGKFKPSEGPTPLSVISKENKPKVFICHASEDKESAAALYKNLEEKGLCPWLDKENLRGGDKWDTVIKRVIHKEIDYFLVLQSKALWKKKISYVNTEIIEALKKQEKFRSGLHFIIPVIIEDCQILEELEKLHSYDLRQPSEMIDLIKQIKEDFADRKD